MDNVKAIAVADDLTTNESDYAKQIKPLNTQEIYEVIDSLAVLKQPIKDYFDMTEEQYYQSESDNKLLLQKLNEPLKQLHDRILTNHVDGFVKDAEINLTYNHEDPFENHEYDRTADLRVLSYSLKVIGALVTLIGTADLKNYLSTDAVLSLGLAAYALEQQE